MSTAMSTVGATRRLIVNADDFGLSSGVNAGIIEAHEHGIVTSTSVMVRWPAAAEIVHHSRKHPRLSVGLHVDLGEWIYRDGEWGPLYEVVPVNDPSAVAAEVARQLAQFCSLMGRSPTHIDSHQHSHREEPLRTIVLDIGSALGVPVRDFTPGVRYFGGFYGQGDHGSPWPEGITAEALLRIVRDLPPGTTELGCHPGLDDSLETMYCRERRQEVAALCDPRVREAIGEDIKLISFSDVNR
jgi:chitin disaccharide deacetylase